MLGEPYRLGLSCLWRVQGTAVMWPERRGDQGSPLPITKAGWQQMADSFAHLGCQNVVVEMRFREWRR
jgi:hypothetical protein